MCLWSDLDKYSRRSPAKIPFPGADFCDETKEQEFLLVGKIKKKKKPKPVHISFRGKDAGDRAYEVFLDVDQSRMEQWSVVGGTEEDVIGDESFIQPGYPFELRFFPSTFLLKAHLKCFRVKCDQDGWNVQEDLRKESTTTFHKVFTKFKHWLAWTPEKQN